MASSNEIIPKGYKALLEDLKQRIRSSKSKPLSEQIQCLQAQSFETLW